MSKLVKEKLYIDKFDIVNNTYVLPLYVDTVISVKEIFRLDGVNIDLGATLKYSFNIFSKRLDIESFRNVNNNIVVEYFCTIQELRKRKINSVLEK